MNEFERMQNVINDYSENYELDRENPWVKAKVESGKKAEKAYNTLIEAMHEHNCITHELGFVEGMKFALDVMSNSKSKSTALLKQFLEKVENSK